MVYASLTVLVYSLWKVNHLAGLMEWIWNEIDMMGSGKHYMKRKDNDHTGEILWTPGKG